jgi:Ni/Fe-hydrogenase subunit HybB-like protein
MTMQANPGKAPRVGFWGLLGWVLIAALGAVTVLRFARGLGAVTNLSDAFPWGLWIGFDILCGVGLAAGGFTVAATVHIFHLDSYRPILRPTILTAFLGYLMVILALAFDLGRPWHIWHPLAMWNPRSVMFEVGWCVTLYTAVLCLEFAPVVLERFRLARSLRALRRLTPVLVIAGVILSTLHQSSLGSLYLILPGKMHPLWYSPSLPLLFFVSALAAGIAMTVAESWFSRRVFDRPLETELLARLSRVSVVVLALFLALRLRDLHARDALSTLLPLSLPSLLFLGEVVVGAALPMVLLAWERFRRSPRRLAFAQGMVLVGFVLHRLDVAITSVEAATGARYLPAFAELVVSTGLVVVGIKIFVAACRWLPIFPGGAVRCARAGSADAAPASAAPLAEQARSR